MAATTTIINGMAIGASLSVVDSTALSNLDPNGLTIGTQVNDLGTPATWTLTISTASTSSTVKAVKGITGWRWVQNTTSTSGADPTWITAARARATTLSSGALTGAREWTSDFLDTVLWDKTVVGTAAASLSTTLDGGVVVLTTGTTGTSQIKVYPVGKPPLTSDLTTKKLYAYWRVRFEGAASTNTKTTVGVMAPALNKWVQFGVVGAAVVTGGSSTKFCIETYDGGASPVETVTAINIDTTLYHNVEAYVDGAGNCSFYLDGALAGTVSITTSVGVIATTVVGQVYTQDTTNRTMDIDAIYASFLGQ